MSSSVSTTTAAVAALTVAIPIAVLAAGTLGTTALMATTVLLKEAGASMPWVWSGDSLVGILALIPCCKLGVHAWHVERKVAGQGF